MFFSSSMHTHTHIHTHIYIYVQVLLYISGNGCQITAAYRNALDNKHLKVAASPWRPFLMWKCPNHTKWHGWTDGWEVDCPNKEPKLFSGAFWELLSFIQQARNCSFELVKSVDSLWGGCYSSNNCTGMIGMVNRREVDFALGMKLS